MLAATIVCSPALVLASNAIAMCQPMPAPLHNVQPEYPTSEGPSPCGPAFLTLEFTISTSGSASDVVVLDNDAKYCRDQFNLRALAALEKMRFATLEKACRGRMRIKFRLADTKSTHNTSLERTREG